MTELDPPLNAAKESGKAPDFTAITSTITSKYNSNYAKYIVTSGKVFWYLYLVHDKKQPEYWPQCNSARIAYMVLNRPDTSARNVSFTNNVCYNEIFLHCNNEQELEKATGFMKNMVSLIPNSFYVVDTYASLLYKSGKTGKAIAEEKKAVDLAARVNKQQAEALFYTITQMQRGAKIWEDKKIIGN